MSDIIREVDEELRHERYKKLWDRFGLYVIGAALLGVLFRAGVPIYAALVLALLASIGLSWIVAVHCEPVVRLWMQRGIEQGLAVPRRLKAALNAGA